jgi:hypothetical protein
MSETVIRLHRYCGVKLIDLAFNASGFQVGYARGLLKNLFANPV